ncbi:hypothetical protein LJC47_03735 [Desulfosarcina sp. OttesenSCG-928-B08]|nr:hypothetical protein [Desulfosarcina sp. OttesenSCG-928-B08]
MMDLLLAAKADPRILGWLSAAIRYFLSLCRPENAEAKIVEVYSRVVDEEEAKKMTTSFVAELEARGEVRGRMEGVLAFLEARFGSVPGPVRNAVVTCTDPVKLNEFTRLAATCESMEAFSKGL